MERRVVLKYINQKLAAEERVQGNPCSLILLQRRIFLNYDQGAGLYLGHLIDSLDQFIHSLVAESGADLLGIVQAEQGIEDILLSQLL